MTQREQIMRCIERRLPVHMVGIGGVGMAGLAFWLQRAGVPVSGCDAADGPLCDWLRGQGISVSHGHDAAHLDRGPGWLIRSTAVAPAHPECVRAAEAGVPIVRRGEVLPVVLEASDRHVIAVCGTHGKTTTACFTAALLHALGLQPGWCIGGETTVLPGVAGDGGGAWIVVEADESDGTLAGYAPDITLVTNVDFDHMEHFASVEAFEACFSAVISRTRRAVLVCTASERAVRLAEGAVAPTLAQTGYGDTPDADVRLVERADAPGGQTFGLLEGDRPCGRFMLAAPGHHNALNAAGAIAAVRAAGAGWDALPDAVRTLALPKRRFECVYNVGDIRVLSDYAHHPVEIAALVQTARARFAGRLRAVFQPHRYTRTRALRDAFAPAFEGVDELVLTPVYAASEAPLQGGHTHDLYAAFRAAAEAGRAGPGTVLMASSPAHAWDWYRQSLRAGDTLLVIGAGDIEQVAVEARALAGTPEPPFGRPPVLPAGLLGPRARAEPDAPLGRRTSFRLGGSADLAVTLEDEADFVALCRWCHATGAPLHIHAAGSNVLVSDLGVRGVTAILDHAAFGTVREAGDGTVVVGPACPLARLLDWCEAHGRGGLESLEGVPGTVGGAMRMNAGAWGVTFGESVSAIRCLFRDGTVATVQQSELGLGYRRCDALESGYVLEVRLALPPADPAAIRTRRDDLAARRRWQRGLRSAGSVFRNPPDLYAAQLIEAAGLKGFRIGGAEVLDHHANIMVASAGARASDVIALIDHVRDTVRRDSGIELQLEVRCLE